MLDEKEISLYSYFYFDGSDFVRLKYRHQQGNMILRIILYYEHINQRILVGLRMLLLRRGLRLGLMWRGHLLRSLLIIGWVIMLSVWRLNWHRGNERRRIRIYISNQELRLSIMSIVSSILGHFYLRQQMSNLEDSLDYIQRCLHCHLQSSLPTRANFTNLNDSLCSQIIIRLRRHNIPLIILHLNLILLSNLSNPLIALRLLPH